MDTFEKELEQLINIYSEENTSNTPDFILVQFILNCLAAYNLATQRREAWYDRDPKPWKKPNRGLLE